MELVSGESNCKLVEAVLKDRSCEGPDWGSLNWPSASQLKLTAAGESSAEPTFVCEGYSTHQYNL